MSHLNVQNRTVFNKDNLDVLRGINSNSIDLIYLDPPFNKKKVFTAPIGSSAEGAEFNDIFREEDIKDEWVSSVKAEHIQLYSYLMGVKHFSNKYNYCYLVYMAIRLMECRRVLKDTGSVYLHCDSTMSHYLKIVMDCIFGEKNFKNEIVWKRTEATKSSFKKFGNVTDTIFFYVKTDKAYWADLRLQVKGAPTKQYKKDENGRYYRKIDIVALPAHGGTSPRYEYKGFTPTTRWLYTKDKVEEMDRLGLLIFSASGRPYKKQYWDEHPGNQMSSLWSDIKGGGHMTNFERTGYPTQKPLALLERIIKVSSNEGDVVLDPFCGCATTCIAAEKLDRQWIGIDVSYKAFELVKERLNKEIPNLLWDVNKELIFSTTPPARDSAITDEERGFVYIISNPAFAGVYKVGIAKNVKQRLNAYQTSDPNRGYKIEREYKCSNYIEVEKLTHANFNGDREHEWVRAKLANIIDFIEGKIEV